MASDIIQIKLPTDMNKLFDDLKEIRAKNFEPTTYLSIVCDAVKAYHKSKTKRS